MFRGMQKKYTQSDQKQPQRVQKNIHRDTKCLEKNNKKITSGSLVSGVEGHGPITLHTLPDWFPSLLLINNTQNAKQTKRTWI